ncbi:MAG: peptidylprolyl isomerase [Deltaproteobacteria bacterium]|nr:peptidylprolyl isomerase [Deltaproteobacteria bacterium]
MVAEDAYWWTPHAVLGVLLLIGLLGFFGFFNNLLGFLAPSSGGSGEGRGKDPGAPHAKIIPQQLRRLPNMADRGAEATRYRARHVLVTYKGAPRAPGSVTRTKEEARARAEEAVKKAHAGAKFEDVVKEYSDDADTTPRGGDLGPFSKGRMVPSFQGAVEKLKVGEVSEVVETPFGYHVILRTL